MEGSKLALMPFFAPNVTSTRFIIATESYGARFGPTFINYFNAQNQRIDSGDLQGVKLVVTALSISK
jgi:hypothetical protein